MNNNYTEIFKCQKQYVLPTYTPSLLMVKGEGLYVWDSNDNRYLDFTSGIGVCNLGHCHPSVTLAIVKQAGKLVHVSNLFMNEMQPRLACKLIEKGFDGAVFFSNSGAEANEGLIKFARKWGSDKGKNEIIVMEESFHGRTLATLAATGRKKYREGFQPDMPGFKHLPFNDFEALKSGVNEKTAAILLEPVQGEGGVIPAENDSYLKKLRGFCNENDILLLFDEVQCGMGRTGKFYAYQNYGVKPDGMALAKALGNGFPIGAIVIDRKYTDVLKPGTHASTFGGTPLACAAALAVIETMEQENVVENCAQMGDYLHNKLEILMNKYDSIKNIRRLGLMVGVVLDRSALDLLPLCQEKGLLALPAGENVLRLLPPLTVSQEAIDTAVDIIDSVFESLQS